MDKFLVAQGVVSGKLRGDLIKGVTDLAAAFGLADSNITSITYALAQVQDVPTCQVTSCVSWRTSTSRCGRPSQIRLALQGERWGHPQRGREGHGLLGRVFDALIKYSGQFENAAQAQSETLKGLLLKLEDIRKFELGQAFLNVNDIEGVTGPIEVAKNILESLVESLEKINFGPLASSIGHLMASMTAPLSGFAEESGIVIKIFEEWLPTPSRPHVWPSSSSCRPSLASAQPLARCSMRPALLAPSSP